MNEWRLTGAGGGSSPLHSARAGVAAAWCLAVSAAALASQHPLVLATLLATAFAAGCLAGVGGALARTALLALPFALAIALINPIVVREGLTVIARGGYVPPFGQLDITLEACAFGGVLGLRALAIVLCCALFSRCVDADELLRAFRRVSFRSAVTAALATRMVPVLARDARRMQAAQRSRAGRPAPRLAVLRAVAASALDRSVDVAATLEVRGYGSGRRPPRRELPWSRQDLAFAASAAGVALTSLVARVGGVADFDPYPRLVSELGAAEASLCALLALIALAPFAVRKGAGR